MCGAFPKDGFAARSTCAKPVPPCSRDGCLARHALVLGTLVRAQLCLDARVANVQARSGFTLLSKVPPTLPILCLAYRLKVRVRLSF